MSLYLLLLGLGFRDVLSVRTSVDVATKHSGAFVLANEKGVTVTDKNSISFSVKACSDAVIVISDVASISDLMGKYFLLMIDKNGNSSQVMDSCFACNRTVIVPGKFLECNVFKPFWLYWDGNGLFEFGKGRATGREKILTIKGVKQNYMANFLQVTSTSASQAVFSFTKDQPLKFTSPKQDGSTVVTVNETTPVNATILLISESPPSPNVTMSVEGKGQEAFYVEGRELRLKMTLDYETTAYYALVVVSDVVKTVAVLISVVDANDEKPHLTVKRHVEIPEEVTIGTVFGGIYNVSDLDKGDNLTLTLSGKASTIFEATGSGHLKVIGRLDRDGPEGTPSLENVTLTVTDLVGHSDSAIFDVRVLDINDNSPVCKPNHRNLSIEENNHDEMTVMNLKTMCYDIDEADNGNLTYTVLGEEWTMSSFTVREGALIVRAHSLDRENGSQCGVTTFFVQVKDNSKGVRRKTYIQVNLEVLAVNEFPPRWKSASTGSGDKLDDINVFSTTPAGTVIANLVATDQDVGDGPLVYTISTIQTDGGRDGSNFLAIDKLTGALSVKNSLTGVLSLLVNVEVSDGKHKVKATVSVSVSSHSANSNPVFKPLAPDFDKRLYTTDAPSLADRGRPLLTFKMKKMATWHAVKVDSAAMPFFSITNMNGWHLVFSGTHNGHIPIPNIVHLIVYDTKTKLDLSTAYVVLNQRNCGNNPRSHLNGSKPSKPNVNHLVQSKGTSSMADHHTTEGSNHVRQLKPGIKPEVPLCMPAYSMTTKLLMAACGAQGAILGGTLIIYICKKLGGEKNSTVVPVRKDPVGCAEVRATKEVRRKNSQPLKYLKGENNSKPLKEDTQCKEDATDMMIDLESKEQDDQVGEVASLIYRDEGDPVIETGGDEMDEVNGEFKDDTNDAMLQDQVIGMEAVATQPTAGSDIDEEAEFSDVKEGMLEGEHSDIDGHTMDKDKVRSEPSGLSRDAEEGEEEDAVNPDGDRLVEGDSLTSLKEPADEVRDDPSLGNYDNMYDEADSENINAETRLGEASESEARLLSEEDTDTREPLITELNPQVIIEETHSEMSDGKENTTVPENSEASDEDNEEMEEDEDAKDNDEAEEEDAGDDIAEVTTGKCGEAAVVEEGGEVVKKRKKYRKVKKEKPKKEKKPKLRKIDFTQSPYNFQTKE